MPWIAAGAAILGGYLSNRASAKQAAIAREEAGRFSGTAHQREAQDLEAAGLNRILSGTGGAGASTPSGMVASQPADYSGAVTTALASRRQKEELKLMNAQRETEYGKAAEAWERQGLLYEQTRHAESAKNVQFMDEAIAKGRLKGDMDMSKFWSSEPYAIKRRADAGLETARKLIPFTTPGHSAYGNRKKQ